MPGLAASNSAMVAFHTGSYCDSVRLAVCHCNTIGCCAAADPAAKHAASAARSRAVRRIGASLAEERARPLGARLRAERHFLQRVEVRFDTETWTLRQQEMSLFEADGHGRRAIAERALRLHLFENEKIRDPRREMHGRRRADRTAGIMRCDGNRV